MRVLLDECIPRKFKNHLPGHECTTVPEAGFAGKKNGELLRLADNAGFECFVTLDRGIEYEQNLANHKVVILLIRSKSSRIQDLITHVPKTLEALRARPSSRVVRVGR
ncbi:MAG: DUF5615 family PIN-like protein [Terriglobales bacterium]